VLVISSPEYRGLEEQRFCASGVWSRLPDKDLGIGSLRQKLCQRFFESIKRYQPVLIREMDNQLRSTRRTIEKIGSVHCQRLPLVSGRDQA
jgi:hypothetical protein